jgi:protein-disulfide isomerase
VTEQRDTSGDLFTVRVPRSAAYLAVGIMIGFVAGFWIARFVTPRTVITAPVPGSGASSPLPVRVTVDVKGRPAKGPSDAKVTLVEFTDYQCPFCKRHFDEVLPKIRSTYGDRIRYVTFNFPVTKIHPFAQKAAEAAECANEQGSFWIYHDYVFRHQSKLDVASLKRYARAVGLDRRRFDRCLESGASADQVAKDVAAGTSYGVTGTPAFFINGTRYGGAAPWEQFKSRIDQAFAAAK